MSRIICENSEKTFNNFLRSLFEKASVALNYTKISEREDYQELCKEREEIEEEERNDMAWGRCEGEIFYFTQFTKNGKKYIEKLKFIIDELSKAIASRNDGVVESKGYLTLEDLEELKDIIVSEQRIRSTEHQLCSINLAILKYLMQG